MGFNCLKATASSSRQFTFYHSFPRNSWYSFHRPQKVERLSRPWSHPVVLNTGPLDWESSALTTRPLQLINSRYTIKSKFINTKSSNVNLPPVFNHWFTFSSDSNNYETSSSLKGFVKG